MAQKEEKEYFVDIIFFHSSFFFLIFGMAGVGEGWLLGDSAKWEDFRPGIPLGLGTGCVKAKIK